MLKNPFERKWKIRPSIAEGGLYSVFDAEGYPVHLIAVHKAKAQYAVLAINNIGPCVGVLQWAVGTLDPEGERAERGVYNKARALLDRIDAECEGG